MSLIKIRKKLLNVESVYHEGGPAREEPIKMASIAIVIHNPYAGRYVEDLTPLVKDATEIAKVLVPELLNAVGGADKVQAYGKGAIVGLNGELEHGAIWHEAGGWSMRAELPKAKSIVPAAKVVASAGTRLQIPLHHIEAAYVRSHFSTLDVGTIDGPRPDELLYALVVSTGSRVHERLGGLRADKISVGDGQR
ncbi:MULTISPECIES: amino acid synthesis family protein [unclassified Acidovorax]|uniref:amino acid synthesis family protein n=1 Tax=unclassified Acidovorax TaxID=2684926 RepID=UPI001C438F10|nr:MULTISPECIES: amino acid synthesis family protein [unclassified Acidovorax]MBV7431666.1 amino acid synthesis family protein [Acidovorax sp. sif0732]MBV7452790.1 amino acid synthesis family protein [Acidovorax sp. sif0715]